MSRFHQMMRVDHAGEYGAVRIYDGQRAVFKNLPSKQQTVDLIDEMAAQEQEHLAAFDTLLAAHRIRPTLLGPLWQIAGFALGAGTALLGEKAAMACTATVEEVIDAHYAEQLETLAADPEKGEICEMIERFRADEAAHRDTALAEGAEEALGYPLLRKIIRGGCKVAIKLSERV